MLVFLFFSLLYVGQFSVLFLSFLPPGSETLVCGNIQFHLYRYVFYPSTVEVTADPFDDTLESPDVEEKGSDVTWRDISELTNCRIPEY